MRRLVALALLAVACTPPERPAAGLEPCLVEGIARPARCGVVEVPEDPGRPEGARIALRVVVVPALGQPVAGDPVLLLAGGPGQAASEAFAPLLPVLGRVGLHRDLVLVDQRGTGASAPIDCPEPSFEASFAPGALVELARRCAPRVKDRALAHYGTLQAADDLEAVRQALGYGRVNLLGVSYGTRLAMVYAARHPTAVRSLVLDGPAPLALRIPLSFARDAQAALDRTMADCAADAGCARSYPALAGTLSSLLDRAVEKPIDIAMPHPRTGAPLGLSLGREPIAQSLRGMLYAPELAALLPLTIAELAQGREARALVGQSALLFDASSEGQSVGLFLTVVCGEDVPRIADADIVPETEGTFLGRGLVDELRAACAAWPGRAPALALGPARTAAALILAGELDPVTPPRWAERAAQQGDVVVAVSGSAHGTLARGCVPELVARFLEQGGGPIDSGCAGTVARPEFFLDRAGPRP